MSGTDHILRRPLFAPDRGYVVHSHSDIFVLLAVSNEADHKVVSIDTYETADEAARGTNDGRLTRSAISMRLAALAEILECEGYVVTFKDNTP